MTIVKQGARWRASIAVLCATLPAAFVVLLFLPSIVYFFNSSFAE
jgi:hypothetical protein